MTTKKVITIQAKNGSYNSFSDFLYKHYTDNESTKERTNTRIPSKDGTMKGGKYHIPAEEYATFLNLYYRDVIAKKQVDSLTEKQLEKDGPIVVDLDLKYNYDVDTRQHTKEHIDDMVDCYLGEIKKIYQFDNDDKFNIFIMEKPNVNRVSEKNYTKDGIHMIIAIQSDPIAQIMLRDRIIPKIEEMWSDLPIINDWESIFDLGISEGGTNWQLFGSKKPGCETYGITNIYEVTYLPEKDDFETKKIKPEFFDIQKNIMKLSVRNTNNPSFFMKSDMINTYNEYKRVNKKGAKSTASCPNDANNSSINSFDEEIGFSPSNLARITNATELEFVVNKFMENVKRNDYELKETFDYLMTLPISYYGEGSYDKWIRASFALKNTSDRLLIAWIAFSAQSPTFSFSNIHDLIERWQKLDMKKHRGLTKRSIMFWSKQDAYEKFLKVRDNSLDYYIEMTIQGGALGFNSGDKKMGGCGDFDIATVVYHYFKDQYVCSSVKSNIWYEYIGNRWLEIDSGTTLRKRISTEIRELYNKKGFGLLNGITTTPNAPNNVVPVNATEDDHANYAKTRGGRIMEICLRLSRTNDKKNIMTEAKELFYDGSFIGKLDTNPYLICFNNGVVDFKEKVFRHGRPEDYISMCTNIDYVPIDNMRDGLVVSEIQEFLSQLFPEKPLYNYMFDHLASTLIGTSANQTFNMYIGNGQNGKSVLVSLMEKVLGEYKGDVPLTLVTESRAKVGGLSPEIVQLKGKRMAVMQEPKKGEVINEGVMKQLTSGVDPIQARAPYMVQSITFYPQFKLVLCANNLMEIKSNDHGTWRRIRVVPFKSLFTNNPIKNDPDKPYQFKLDLTINEKFDEWKQIFAAMLVERVFETGGVVKDCDIVMLASNEYRAGQDVISEFIRDKVVRCENSKIKKTELNNEFLIWHQSTYGTRGPNAKDVHEYMDKQFSKQENGCWKNVRIKYERDEVEIPDIHDDIEPDDL
jgi:P4 family phage/plasmid primase-like protien